MFFIKVSKLFSFSKSIIFIYLSLLHLYILFSKLKIKDGTVNKEGIEKNQFKKSIELKENKMKYKQSGAVEANMVGNIIGHFIANYDQFKKADLDNKKIMIRDAALPIASLLGRKIIGAIPVFKNTCLGSIFRNGFIIVSVFELCRNCGKKRISFSS